MLLFHRIAVRDEITERRELAAVCRISGFFHSRMTSTVPVESMTDMFLHTFDNACVSLLQ